MRRTLRAGLLLLALAGCGNEPVASAPSPTEAPTAAPTATPEPTCQELMQAYVKEAKPLRDEFLDSLKVAKSTARMSLAPQIESLQRIKRETAKVTAPECAGKTHEILISGMATHIDGMLEFLGQGDDGVVFAQQKLADTMIEAYDENVLTLLKGEKLPGQK